MTRKMYNVRHGKIVFADSLIERINQNHSSDVQSILCGIRYPEDFMDSDRTTLLHLSAKYNNEKLTEYLIDCGCDVNARNIYGETPLLWAVRTNSFNTIKQLLGKNADIYTSISPDSRSILEIILTSEEEIPVVIIKYLFAILKNDCRDDEELADILAIVNCPLYYVVLLKNAEFTRKMLRRVLFNNARNINDKDLNWKKSLS